MVNARSHPFHIHAHGLRLAAEDQGIAFILEKAAEEPGTHCPGRVTRAFDLDGVGSREQYGMDIGGVVFAVALPFIPFKSDKDSGVYRSLISPVEGL